MIDIEKAKQEFIKYTNQYDAEEPNIKRKIGHSIRVMEISEQLTQKMELEPQKIELAKLIGLLHDIARFEQYKEYQTFSDLDSIDHGDHGIKILTQEDFLRKFIKTTKYDNIILKAIKNHNKFAIEEKLNEEERFFSKIIRDADKLDIFYESVELFWVGTEEVIENSKITKENLERIKNKKLIERKKGEKVKGLDKVIRMISFVFDLNYKESFQILKESDNMNKIIDRFDYKIPETKEEMNQIKKIVNQYIDEKIG